MAILTYLGHNSFRLSSNDNRMVVYIDPYAGDDYTIPADLILVSHEHFDHNQTDLVQLKPFGKIMRAENFIQEGKYQTFNFHGLKVEGVPAENINHSIKECVGFVIEVDGVKLYFACDTSKTDYMHELAKRHLDYAFLPCDGKYNMDVKEASECAEIIKVSALCRCILIRINYMIKRLRKNLLISVIMN